MYNLYLLRFYKLDFTEQIILSIILIFFVLEKQIIPILPKREDKISLSRTCTYFRKIYDNYQAFLRKCHLLLD